MNINRQREIRFHGKYIFIGMRAHQAVGRAAVGARWRVGVTASGDRGREASLVWAAMIGGRGVFGGKDGQSQTRSLTTSDYTKPVNITI